MLRYLRPCGLSFWMLSYWSGKYLVKDVNGLITADNTDVYGFEYLVKVFGSCQTKKAIVLGAVLARQFAMRKKAAYVGSPETSSSSSFVYCNYRV